MRTSSPRSRPRRDPGRRCVLARLALLGVAVAALSSSSAATPAAPRFGLFSVEGGAVVDEAAAGLRDGLRVTGLDPELLERSVGDDEATARAALNEFALEGVDVVFVLGPAAARLARDTLREPSVVFAAVGYPEVLGLPGRGNVCGVAGGVEASVILEWARRNAPGLRTLGVVAGADAESRSLSVALAESATQAGLAVSRASAADAHKLAGACEAVWLPPGLSDREAETIARALEGKGVPLLGSRRGHLDAGCSAVLRTSPHAQGMHAAALGRRVLRGDAPGTIGVVSLRRRVSEVSLNAARRLGHDVPISVVATADHLVPALGGRR